MLARLDRGFRRRGLHAIRETQTCRIVSIATAGHSDDNGIAGATSRWRGRSPRSPARRRSALDSFACLGGDSNGPLKTMDQTAVRCWSP